MNKQINPLDNLRIASPCTASWDAMKGSDSARFCGECCKNVYNLSAMTRAEAEELLAGAEGRVCVRYYQRADGTVLTEDCPVGVRTVRQRVARWARTVAASVLALFAGGVAANVASAGGSPRMGGVGISRVDPSKKKIKKADTVQAQRPDTLLPEQIVMGEMAYIPEPDTAQLVTPVDSPAKVAPRDSEVIVPVQITIPVITANPLDPVTVREPATSPTVQSNSSAHIQ